MHKRVVFNFGKFKSRKCLISFSRDYVRKGEKNKKALKIKAFRGYIFFIALFWLAVRGIFHCPPQSHSRNARKAYLCFISPCLVGYRGAKTCHRHLFACSPTTSCGGCGSNSKSASRAKRKPTRLGWFSFCERAIKKIFWPFCLRDLNSRALI